MNKVISFSLWGNNPRYSIGAIRNCEIANEYYRGWNINIYYYDIEQHYIDRLNEFKNVNLIYSEDKLFISPYFWRFFAFFEPNNTFVLSRDCDSRLSLREKECADQWILSNKKICIIRDHIRHYDFPMLAGMFGIKDGLTKKHYDLMLDYGKHNYYTVDQNYLTNCVWNDYKDDVFEIGIKTDLKFNLSRNNNLPHFVGQGYTENEKPIYPVE